jgi:hypothetical protein
MGGMAPSSCDTPCAPNLGGSVVPRAGAAVVSPGSKPHPLSREEVLAEAIASINLEAGRRQGGQVDLEAGIGRMDWRSSSPASRVGRAPDLGFLLRTRWVYNAPREACEAVSSLEVPPCPS